jgi:hypothetical protein
VGAAVVFSAAAAAVAVVVVSYDYEIANRWSSLSKADDD